ncbi:MAG: hypothetical protein Q9163_003616 [Psora crenata]
MGAPVSRELESRLHEARLKVESAEAERANSLSVDGILFEDENFVKRLAAAWKKLPPASKAKISGSQPRTKNARINGGQPRTKKAIFKSKTATAISLSDYRKDCLVSWKASPSTFLQGNEVQFGHQKTPYAQVYNLLCALEKSQTANQIQRRILVVVIHRLKKKLCVKLRRDAFHHIALKIHQSGLVRENQESILTNLNTWAKAGARYDALATDLGGLGSLTLLPDDIGPTVWEVTLPMTGGTHDEMVASLKERGICDEAGKRWNIAEDGHTQASANEIADELFEHLWAMVDQLAWTETQTPFGDRSYSLDSLIDAAGGQHSQLGIQTNPQEEERYPQANNPSTAVFPDLGSGAAPPSGGDIFNTWYPEPDGTPLLGSNNFNT